MPSVRATHLAALVLGAAVGVAACGGSDAPATTSTPPRTTSAAAKPAAPPLCGALRTRVAGRVDAPEATELSGLVASPSQPGILWSHNDSGDRARLFALRTDGSLVASLDVPGAQAVDWEDIAVGPGGDLLAADIGDNAAKRPTIIIYRVPEPRLAARPATTAPATPLRLTYPDGAHDAETLLADRRTGELVVVTKSLDGRSGVYAGSTARGDQQLRRTGGLRLGFGGLATAGDVSADGRVIAIRTYSALYVWARRPGATLAATLRRAPCVGRAQLAREGQGESLALNRDGRSFFTVPEGAAPTLRQYTTRK
jgi:outer membrane protein assembly factor BamB